MNEFIWRPKHNFSEPYEQSRKEDNPIYNTSTETVSLDREEIVLKETVHKEELVVKKTIVDPTTFYDNNGIFRMSSTKREEVNLKMHEREPMSQRNQNPYLVQNNYIDDLETQQSFLMPKNSNFSKKQLEKE